MSYFPKRTSSLFLALMVPASVAMALTLTGCDMLVSGEGTRMENDAKTGPVAPTKSAKKVDPLDEAIAAAEEYGYNPIGKRDPFRSFLSFGVREQDTPRTPLQKFEIDQYSLVGIIWGIDRPRALVEDPEGVGHVMEIGTYIGRNWGKVTQITSGEAVVTEEYQTIDGELVVNNISMTLPVAGDGSVR
jgi:type IV pilus assembly protein PilP